MTIRKTGSLPAETLKTLRERAERTRQGIANSPNPSDHLTPEERADAAPFYFVLREYVRQLKEARLASGLTLAEVAEQTGMAVESLSRLETGAQTNPTWKTLGLYAAAVGCRPVLTADVVAAIEGKGMERPADGPQK